MFLFAPQQLRRLPKMEGRNPAAADHEQVHPRHYWIRAVFSLLLIVLVLVGIVLPFHWDTLSASLQQYILQRVSTATVSAAGLVQGRVYNLTFENPSGGFFPISEIDVTQGQHVRQGQVLARLDQTLFQRNVDAARAAVVAAQNRVNVTLARRQRAIQEAQALIAEAETNFQVAQTTLRATNLQAQANIAAAQATLASDQQVLAATQQQAKAQIKAGQAQLAQSIANCQPTSQSGTATPPSRNTSTSATIPSDTVKACIHQAEAQYAQTVATAQTSIVAAQAQITKDQAAIVQATMAAGVAVAIAQGSVATTRSHIPVAIYDPDLLVAAKEVAEAQESLTQALEQLHTAQLNLITDTILIAPHDGVVTAINGTIGGQSGIHVNIAPKAVGSAETGVAIQLVDLSHVDQLLLDVDEADIVKVKVGQHVQFTLKAYGNRQFSGTVSAISPNGVALDSGMAYPVIVSIAVPSVVGVTLFPNMTATASIVVG